MARTISAIRIETKQEQNCMGRTCLKWRSNGELNEHDVALILQRLREVDPEAEGDR